MVKRKFIFYLFAFIGPVLLYLGICLGGWLTWALPLYAFTLIPVVELFIKPKHSQLNDGEAERLLASPLFDLLVYAMVPVQWFLLILYLQRIGSIESMSERIGLTLSMGTHCGAYAINVAHELGHRSKRIERVLARILLLSSLYMHFIIEHNRGHHRHVGTPNDPASARYGESLYAFWARSVVMSWVSAWNIEKARLSKMGVRWFSVNNQMIQALILQGSLISAIWLIGGRSMMTYFLLVAGIGILLLEAVNYIEHYGLRRATNDSGKPVKVQHVHSWNSDHVLGRITLFELSRHSDHHYRSSKKYQVLDGIADCPQLPTGYPGSILLALVPPLWFNIVNPLIRHWVDMSDELIPAVDTQLSEPGLESKAVRH